MKNTFAQLLFGLQLLLISCTEFLSPNVSALELKVLSPPDSLFTDREVIHFRWQPEDLAESYHFQLFVAEGGQQYLLTDSLLREAELRLRLPEGSYRWQLRAFNESSTSAFQTQNLFVDRTAPVPAQALYPLPGDSLAPPDDPLALRWQSGDAVGDGQLMAVRDSVYFYHWRGGWPFLLQAFALEEKAEKLILLEKALAEGSNLQAGEYRWEVKSFDRLGHASCSRLFNFFLP